MRKDTFNIKSRLINDGMDGYVVDGGGSTGFNFWSDPNGPEIPYYPIWHRPKY